MRRTAPMILALSVIPPGVSMRAEAVRVAAFGPARHGAQSTQRALRQLAAAGYVVVTRGGADPQVVRSTDTAGDSWRCLEACLTRMAWDSEEYREGLPPGHVHTSGL